MNFEQKGGGDQQRQLRSALRASLVSPSTGSNSLRRGSFQAATAMLFAARCATSLGYLAGSSLISSSIRGLNGTQSQALEEHSQS